MIKNMKCPSCGHNGEITVFMPGSLMMEGLLWMLIVPGLIYSIWRRRTKRVICPHCSTEYRL